MTNTIFLFTIFSVMEKIGGVFRRLLISVAVAAFLVSFVGGVVFGFSLRTLLLRSILFGLGYGCLFFVCNLILHKYLPELFTDSESSQEEGVQPSQEKGENVDITVEEAPDAIDNSEEKDAEPLARTSDPNDIFYELDNLTESTGSTEISEGFDDRISGLEISSENQPIDELVNENPPEIMAKAVRNVMKQDDED